MAAAPLTFEDKVRATVQRHAMLQPDDCVLVAVSGGQDSVALLQVLRVLADELRLTLSIGHLHHGLRAEAGDRDARYVQRLAQRWRLPVTVQRTDVAQLARERGLSLEQAGREARHSFLRQLAADTGCNKIALGHTATDRAETVLMNILRGAGLEGLRGIPPVNGPIVRPLIAATRPETLLYCRRHHLRPRRDSTNLDTQAFLRNRIRQRLLPLVRREYAPGVEAALIRLADIATEDLDWTEALVAKAFATAADVQEGAVRLDLAALAGHPSGLRRRLLRRALASLQGDLTGFTMQHVEALGDLACEGRTGAELYLPFEVRAEREYNALVLTTSGEPALSSAAWETRLEIPGQVTLPYGGRMTAHLARPPRDFTAVQPNEAYLDAEVAGDALVVRGWRPGDRIAPLGMAGTRKLQDLFVDAKVPRHERHRVPVVVGTEDRVLWVAGLAVARSAAVGPETSRCVHFTWEPESSAKA